MIFIGNVIVRDNEGNKDRIISVHGEDGYLIAKSIKAIISSDALDDSLMSVADGELKRVYVSFFNTENEEYITNKIKK